MSDLGPLAEVVEAHDPVRFSCILLAPSDKRRGLLALLALNAELARVSALVHEPMIGEIRLAWWRESLAGLAHEHTRGHKVLEELLPLLRAGTVTAAELEDVAAARIFDIGTDTMVDEPAFAAYARSGAGALARISLRYLDCNVPEALTLTASRAALRINHLAGIWGNLARGKLFLGAAPHFAAAEATQMLAARPPQDSTRNWFADQIAQAQAELSELRASWQRVHRAALPVFAPLRIARKILKRVASDPFIVHAPPTPGERARAVLMAALTGRPL